MKFITCEFQPEKPPEGKCDQCWGEKIIEFSGIIGEDEKGYPIIQEGIYDPCPFCNGTGEKNVNEI